MIDLAFPYSVELRKEFQKQVQLEHWAERYPQLFDDQDAKLARNQTGYACYHFVEWMAAVLLYESTRYRSLLTKYACKSHERKLAVFREVAPKDVVDYILDDSAGAPDLFCYTKDLRDWFFCEVKGPGDSLKPVQLKRIARIEHLSRKQVYVLQLREL